MNFFSTRGNGETVPLHEAVRRGLAPDGGLYVPEQLPARQSIAPEGTLAATAVSALTPFFSGDSMLESHLGDICAEAFDFPVPATAIKAGSADCVLELYHGPTAAFKDVGAKFLAACLTRMVAQSGAGTLTILVATSGDTGGAVAAAFDQQPGIEVFVLYPKGMVSARQEQQLTCWSSNVHALRVDGTFDDCQRMVKSAFVDQELQRSRRLSSANSISIGRLLPQMVYYIHTSEMLFAQTGRRPGFIIPTGNLGNALACIWARSMGYPIGDVILATNANRSIPDFLDTGTWAPNATVATLASAMDVGDPSNMERLRHLFPDFDDISTHVSAHSVTDEQIRTAIANGPEAWERTWCPHTATAAHIYEDLVTNDTSNNWVIVATAHPAKFETIVEPLIGEAVPLPEALEVLLALPSVKTDIPAGFDALKAALT